MGFNISIYLFCIFCDPSSTTHIPSGSGKESFYSAAISVYSQLPVLPCIVGEAVREGGSRSSKLSGAGGGRFFRDLDLLAEYMFSSSAYTADSLCGGNVQRNQSKTLCSNDNDIIASFPVRMGLGTYIGEVVGSLRKGGTIS